MKKWIGYALACMLGMIPAAAVAADKPSDDDKDRPEFSPAVALKAGGKLVTVGSPGYASPCLADVDGDGTKDLLVGQFAGGRIKLYKGLGDGKFDKGEWLKAEGEVVSIPGVW